MSNPKISVIVPVYNVENYISECLDSIVNQTLKDIEIICVNDGSTDNSPSILKEYASKDKRVKIIDKENEGQGYARKVGLDNAIGKYILFCDSDDYYSELTAFEELYNCAENNKIDLVTFDFFRLVFNTHKFVFLTEEIDKIIFNYKDIKDIYKVNTSPCLRLYSKSFLDRYDDWYFPKKVFYEDTPFHFQVLFRAKNIYYYKKPFYVYVKRNNSSTTKLKTDKNFVDIYITTKATLDFVDKLQLEDVQKIKNQLLIYFLNKLNMRFDRAFLNIKNVEFVINSIKLFDLSETDDFVYKSVEKKTYYIYKAIKRFSPIQFRDYINKKQFREQDIIIQQLNNQLKKQLISVQDQTIKQLKNSWQYRIGQSILSFFSIPLDFYRYIRDYNLIKKSGLFDSKYYLSQNEDVKKAKMDPIKHYLKFGWKEGRNPSAEFNGNQYLNKRPDVRVASMCPLVHYIKFGKDENNIFIFNFPKR